MKNNGSRFINIFSGKRGAVITAVICAAAIISCLFALCSALYVGASVKAYNESIANRPAPQSDTQIQINEEIPPESTADPVTDPIIEKITEPVTEKATEKITEPVTEKVTEQITEKATEQVTEPVTEKVTEPVTEKVTEPEEDKYIVCLDAGHGFDDPGTDCDAFGSWSEKNITLDITLRAGRIIEAAAERSPLPLEVYYTRTQNTLSKSDPRNKDGYYVFNPYMREEFIKTLGTVDAIVSIHCDSYEQDGSIDGTRVFYCKGASDFGASLAVSVKEGISETVGTAHSGTSPEVQWLPYDDAYYITKCTAFPSILVETGFVTNKYDAANMMNAEWRQTMAEGIAKGILDFLGIGD